MPIPLLDLTRNTPEFQKELEAAVLGVLRSGRYILGPEVEALERELAEYIGVRHVVGLSSGTDALLAALMALDIGPGDAVVMPVYTFFATAGVVARLGATPVFVDVEPTWLNIDSKGLEAVLEAGDNIKAVVPVHLFGAGADMNAVKELCDARSIPIVEDACQAIGTLIDGTMAGGIGLCGAFSTFPSKNLASAGEGGFLSTNDDAFATKVRFMRNHGQTGVYEHTFVGGNFRIDAMQAAVLRVRLRYLEEMTEKRRKNAQAYAEGFAGLTELAVPTDADRHCYHQYVTHFADESTRDRVRATLQDQKIGCAVYYPAPLHMQPCFAELGYAEGDFPVAENASRCNLALPIYADLRTGERNDVIHAVREALA